MVCAYGQIQTTQGTNNDTHTPSHRLEAHPLHPTKQPCYPCLAPTVTGKHFYVLYIAAVICRFPALPSRQIRWPVFCSSRFSPFVSYMAQVEADEEFYLLSAPQPLMRLLSGEPWLQHLSRQHTGIPVDELRASPLGPPVLSEGAYRVVVRWVPAPAAGEVAASQAQQQLIRPAELASFVVADQREAEVRAREREAEKQLITLKQALNRAKEKEKAAQEDVEVAERELAGKLEQHARLAATQAADEARMRQLEGRLEQGAWSALPGCGSKVGEEAREDGGHIKLFNVEARSGVLTKIHQVMANVPENLRDEVR